MSQENKSVLTAEIKSLFAECLETDWDGYGAGPLSQQSAALAMTFIESMPDTLIMPELSASPDGGVTLEWVADGNILSVAIYKDVMIYAQLIGGSKQYGEINFSREIPDAILIPLLKFFQK